MAKYVKAIKTSDGCLFWIEEDAQDHEYGLAKEVFVAKIIEEITAYDTVEKTKTMMRNTIYETVDAAARLKLVLPELHPEIEKE